MGMADRIKERRIAMDFTQEELAQKLGLQKSAIAKYEKGRVENIKRSIIEKMSELLDCSPAYLMGFDVPMERNSYEDQNVLRFDAALEEIQEIIESSGYKMLFYDDSDDVVIKTHDNDIVTCMHDYELVGKYESLQNKGIPVTIETLVEDSNIQTWLNREYAFDCQLKVLGWTYKILFEADPINEGHGRATALFKNKDISFKASMKDCDSFINDAESFFKERLQQLLKKSMKQMFIDDSYELKAAHHDNSDDPEQQRLMAEDMKDMEDNW